MIYVSTLMGLQRIDRRCCIMQDPVGIYTIIIRRNRAQAIDLHELHLLAHATLLMIRRTCALQAIGCALRRADASRIFTHP